MVLSEDTLWIRAAKAANNGQWGRAALIASLVGNKGRQMGPDEHTPGRSGRPSSRSPIPLWFALGTGAVFITAH
jgi:hypothetical protein